MLLFQRFLAICQKNQFQGRKNAQWNIFISIYSTSLSSLMKNGLEIWNDNFCQLVQRRCVAPELSKIVQGALNSQVSWWQKLKFRVEPFFTSLCNPTNLQQMCETCKLLMLNRALLSQIVKIYGAAPAGAAVV